MDIDFTACVYDYIRLIIDTVDKVFLLSVKELLYYFPNQADRKAEPTSLASNNTSMVDSYIWRLRTTGFSVDCYNVNDVGYIDDSYEYKIGIRPAIVVKLDTAE